MASGDLISNNVHAIKGGLVKSKQTNRNKVISFYNLGHSGSEIAEKTGIAETEVQQVLLNYLKDQSK